MEWSRRSHTYWGLGEQTHTHTHTHTQFLPCPGMLDIVRTTCLGGRDGGKGVRELIQPLSNTAPVWVKHTPQDHHSCFPPFCIVSYTGGTTQGGGGLGVTGPLASHYGYLKYYRYILILNRKPWIKGKHKVVWLIPNSKSSWLQSLKKLVDVVGPKKKKKKKNLLKKRGFKPPQKKKKYQKYKEKGAKQRPRE